jgi:hypothetical protein
LFCTFIVKNQHLSTLCQINVLNQHLSTLCPMNMLCQRWLSLSNSSIPLKFQINEVLLNCKWANMCTYFILWSVIQNVVICWSYKYWFYRRGSHVLLLLTVLQGATYECCWNYWHSQQLN